jgi:hypothetical protein
LNENENKEPKTKDYLENLPLNVKKEIVAYLADTVYSSIEKSFDPKNYK